MKKLQLIILLLISGLSWAQQRPAGVPEQRTTYITGKLNNLKNVDTLFLVVHGAFYFGDSYIDGSMNDDHIYTTTPDQHGRFKFRLQTENSPFHISLILSSLRSLNNDQLKGKSDIDDYLISAGDSIDIKFERGMTSFAGKGALLFKAQQNIAQSDQDNELLTYDVEDLFRKNTSRWLAQKDSLLSIQLGLLSFYKNKLSPLCYQIVRGDIISNNRSWLYRRISFEGPFFVKGIELRPNFIALCDTLKDRPDLIALNTSIALSPKYSFYLYNKLKSEIRFQRILNNQDALGYTDFFDLINLRYQGVLKDKLLTYWLNDVTGYDDKEAYFTSALQVMRTPFYIDIVKTMQFHHEKSQPIKDFNFPDKNGKNVKLSDFKGKVVLVDLWFTGCTGCIAVAKGMPDIEHAFKGQDVAFISLSVDGNKDTWLKSIDKNHRGRSYTHYTTEDAIYLYTGGTAGRNEFVKTYVPSLSFPSLMIIDREGRLVSATPPTPVNPKEKAELIADLRKALASK